MTVLTDTQVVTASGGLVELGYATASTPSASITVSATTSTYATATTIIADTSVVCDGSPVQLDFQSPNVYPSSNVGDYIVFALYRDATFLSLWGQVFTPTAAANPQPVTLLYRDAPTAGAHTYAVKAYRGAANGTVGASLAGGWAPTFLRVSKIVQATQWPAATTGSIICTSSTRPASPFVGQQIYETDTSLLYVYSGSAWVKVLQQKSTTTTGWTNATYQNSWVSYGSPFSAARYIKDDLGVVHLDGFIMNGTMGASAFTLPAGFRPAYQQIYAVVTHPNAIGRMDVFASGEVKPQSGSNTNISLAGITFLAEA